MTKGMDKEKIDLTKLKERQDILISQLQKAREILQGSIVELYRSCGQKGCRCQRGFKHGPAYYLSRTVKGTTKMEYITKDKINDVRERVENYKRFKNILKELLELNEKIFFNKKVNP